MPRLRLDLDLDTFEALALKASSERRPVTLQAEVIIRQALGLQFPYLPKSVANLPSLREDSHD
jgi:hypothetical protein